MQGFIVNVKDKQVMTSSDESRSVNNWFRQWTWYQLSVVMQLVL